MNIITINQNHMNTQYLSIGDKPYPDPSTNSPHPQLLAVVKNSNNHNITFTLDTTQKDSLQLDLIVDYQLYLSPKTSKTVYSGTIDILNGTKDLEFNNLIENKTYILQLEFYNPYYSNYRAIKTIEASTTNSNTIDFSDIGKQNQDRDNSLTLTLMLDDHPDNYTIELQDIQKVGGEEPILKINLSQKQPNQELKIKITNLPYGLYNLNIYDKTGVGFVNDFTLSKYDNGRTTTTSFPGFFKDKKTILINFGKIEFESAFTNDLAQLSTLDEIKNRRARRASFSSGGGSFFLSAGSNRAGND